NFLTLSYDREARLGKAEWAGRLQGPELREAFLLILELVDRFSLTRWLADDRLMGDITPADLEWSLEVYVPRLSKSSMLRMARLPSAFEQSRTSVDVMISKGSTYNLNLILRDFADEKEAMEWLMQPLLHQNKYKHQSV
ncbi:hypothetical protein, partial [Pontibacter rugosus]